MLGEIYLKVVMHSEGECLSEITYWNNNRLQNGKENKNGKYF